MNDDELTLALRRCVRAQQDDSNDDEIDALWDALIIACTRLDVEIPEAVFGR